MLTSNHWSDAPVFIIGNPRSGTTMLQLMLTCHPQLVVPTECGFVIHLYATYRDFDGDAAQREAFVRDVFLAKKFELWRMDEQQTLQYVTDRQPQTFQQLASSIYEAYGTSFKPSALRWGDKNNYYLQHILDLDAIFPKAQFIHIVRDGRDVACSYKDMQHFRELKYGPNLPHRVEEIAQQWQKNVLFVRDCFATIDSARVIEVRYEDLVVEPAQQLSRLCDFLGLPYAPEMLTFNEQNREKQLVPKELTPWKQMNESFVTDSQTSRWKQDLSPEEVSLFEAIAADTLRLYEYL
jgi:hypothetical protein